MLDNSRKKYINPSFLIDTLADNLGQPVDIKQQMDVEEFFTNFIDRIDRQLQKEFSIPFPEDGFTGKLYQEIIGIDCTHSNSKIDNFLTLSVSIKGMNTLEKSLDHYTCWDTLEEDNLYFCDNCNCKVKAKKRISIHSLPNILTISLKRFEFDMSK